MDRGCFDGSRVGFHFPVDIRRGRADWPCPRFILCGPRLPPAARPSFPPWSIRVHCFFFVGYSHPPSLVMATIPPLGVFRLPLRGVCSSVVARGPPYSMGGAGFLWPIGCEASVPFFKRVQRLAGIFLWILPPFPWPRDCRGEPFRFLSLAFLKQLKLRD